MKNSVWMTWLAVGGILAVAIAPISLGDFKREIASWHLAAAANALESGKGDFKQSFQRAAESGADLTELQDYWIIEMMLAIAQFKLDQDPQAMTSAPAASSILSIDEVLEQAKASGADHRRLALFALRRLTEQDVESYRRLEIQLREYALNESQRKNPEFLNQLAYLRALEAFELDQALKDINSALEEEPDQEAFLDTRAWVLYQMGDPQRALEDADQAVDNLEKTLEELRNDWRATLTLPPRVLDLEPDPKYLELERPMTQTEAGSAMWNMAVMRYHRARILESLGRTDEAEKDFDWLRERNLPTDDRLQ